MAKRQRRESFHPNDLPRREARKPIRAAFDSRCRACGERILEGDDIQGVYDTLKKRTDYCHAGECAEEWAE